MAKKATTRSKAAAKGAKGRTRAKAKNLSPKQAGKVKGGLIAAPYSSTLTKTAIARTTIPTKLYE